MQPKNRRKPAAGFTLIEALIALALLGLVVLIGFPALMGTIHRARTQTTVREVAMELRAARLEAIKRNRRTYVQADFSGDRLAVFRENDGNEALSPGDDLVRQLLLPSQVQFWGPADSGAKGPDAMVSVPAAALPAERYLVFTPSGAAEFVGAIRLADPRGNFLEVRVDPPATAKVTLRKWDPDINDWTYQGEGDQRWSWD